MSFSSFLIEHTLTTVFHGDKGAYADAIGMDEANLRRAVRQAPKGDENDKVVDRTFALYSRCRLDIASVALEYQSLVTPSDGLVPTCAQYHYVKRARAKLEKHKALVDGREDDDPMFQNAYAFLESLDKSYCGNNPDQRHRCKFFHIAGHYDDLDERIMKNCLCKRLDEMVNALCIATKTDAPCESNTR